MKKLWLILIPFYAFAQAPTYWACDDGTRVMQTDTSHWSRTVYDSSWDGTTVRLFGAKNEIVAFQLIISGGAEGRDSVNVTFDTLAKGASYIKNTIGADSTQYVGLPIELFVEQYIQIDSLENPNGWVKGNCTDGAVPDDSVWLGKVPDALVPIKAQRGTYDNGQGGGPFDIAADQIQGVWCDIYIPKSTASGTYTGNMRLWEKGVITASIPVSLVVKNFTLPDSTHMKNYIWLDYAPFSGHVPQWVSEDSLEMQNKDLFQKFMNFFHRHRVGAVNSISYNTFAAADGYQQYLTGDGYSAEKGYDGPGVGIGGNFYAIGQFLQPWAASLVGFPSGDKSAWGPAGDQWQDWFDENLPNLDHALYMWDEPFNENEWYDSLTTYKGNTVRFPFYWIGTLNDSLDASAGSAKNLPIMMTTAHIDAENEEWYWPDLEDLGIDWYICAGNPDTWVGYNVDTANAGRTADDLRAMGNKVGVYNDERPAWGDMNFIMAPQTEHRAGPWVWWKYGVDLYFHWGAGYAWGKWRFESEGYDSVEARYFNPWSNIAAQYASWTYPGTDSTWIPGDDRNWPGPIGSIRLAMLRRGLQDYEYLWLADSSGIDVDSLVNSVVPNGMNDSTGGWSNLTDYPTYEHNSEFFEAAREYLANLLSQPESTPTTKRRRLIKIQIPSTE